MNNSVGQAVRGNDFWRRVNELASIWSAIESGRHILLLKLWWYKNVAN